MVSTIRSGSERLGGLKMRNSVLETFRDNLLAHSYWKRRKRSRFTTFFIILGSLWAYKRFVSSAKWWVIQFSRAWFISFMYMMKSRGPSIEPWGTPHVIACLVEVQPFNLTHWSLFDKYDLSQQFALPLCHSVQAWKVISDDWQSQKPFQGQQKLHMQRFYYQENSLFCQWY